MSTPTVTRPPARQGTASPAPAKRTGKSGTGDAAGVVLLVVMPEAVSKSAICLAAELAAGGPVIVMAIQRATPRLSPARPAGPATPAGPSSPVEQERVRRVVAVAMSSLEDLGATALGHISVTRSPGRALARAVRTRGARAVVLDQQAAPGLRRAEADLTGELRRRLHGSGIIVAVASPDRPAPRHAVLPRTKPAGPHHASAYAREVTSECGAGGRRCHRGGARRLGCRLGADAARPVGRRIRGVRAWAHPGQLPRQRQDLPPRLSRSALRQANRPGWPALAPA
jgi:hypothetical protein